MPPSVRAEPHNRHVGCRVSTEAPGKGVRQGLTARLHGQPPGAIAPIATNPCSPPLPPDRQAAADCRAAYRSRPWRGRSVFSGRARPTAASLALGQVREGASPGPSSPLVVARALPGELTCRTASGRRRSLIPLHPTHKGRWAQHPPPDGREGSDVRREKRAARVRGSNGPLLRSILGHRIADHLLHAPRRKSGGLSACRPPASPAPRRAVRGLPPAQRIRGHPHSHRKSSRSSPAPHAQPSTVSSKKKQARRTLELQRGKTRILDPDELAQRAGKRSP